MDSQNGRMSILMLPHLAHGHISPFLELAKQLTKRNFNVYLCSTPINLASIKNRVRENDNIQLIEFHLPSSPCLPPHYHSTNGLPSNLHPILTQTFEISAPIFINILKDINPNLVIYDVIPSWPAEVALALDIPAIHFSTHAASTCSLGLHFYKKPGEKFPFPHIFDSSTDLPPLSEDDLKLIRNFVLCFERSCNLVLVKSVREVEGKYIDLLSDLVEKDIIPVGQLIHVPTETEDDNLKNIMEWLDKKEKSSVLFICFGSENYLSAEEAKEMANALETTKCNFIWAVRSPQGEEKGCLLPEGFVDRVRDIGLILEWAPQTKILGHSSTGAFLSHCGWSSVNESMKFGVPIIGIPMEGGDQPTNAKLAVEIGVGLHIPRNSEGKFKSEAVGDVIRKVLVEESGEVLRKKATELSLRIKGKGEADLDKAAEKLMHICRKNKSTYQ
ncbi:Glycosyltransferase [Heracleum sosnowskyi]|uniref:Glycosyltransferase n=1 Tax=Heracleum sosnowskyi TaxID=360622 RepID=A0AAD8I4T8_9APIA|nr:Glycosyltransferase [Heracleum sosnowskyi]